ncbi:ImmA/IrrE family metallo-endopeptidase [Kribbella kalugense]|uniref:ImmA/IrrE family metallo-endopeptidase n=1 Tax=Kribbella kalugense TaxID=2512221 RepID=UPI001066208B|nr:ImmA/IrrE family metallo-endopeptidase [Kribbella kalugense]
MWDVSQTDGRPFQVVPARPPREAFAALQEVAIASGYGVERGPLPSHGDGAETADRRRRIVVADDLDVPMAAMSLAHELAHLRMHKRLRGASCHGVIRLEATSAAYLVLSRLGCLPDQSSADLIARTTGVVSRTPPVRLIETLGGRVVATANRLYDAAERHLPPPHLQPAKPTLLTDAPRRAEIGTPGHLDPGSDRGPTP